MKREVSFSERNGFDGQCIFELGVERLAMFPYVLRQVSARGYVWCNRAYHCLPDGKLRLEEAEEVAVLEFDTDPRTWEGVWADATGRDLYLWSSQFELLPDVHERLLRFQMYRAGCVGRS